MKNKIFNSFLIEIFISKIFSKVSNKNEGEKTIKYIILHLDENNIFNSFSLKFCFSLSL